MSEKRQFTGGQIAAFAAAVFVVVVLGVQFITAANYGAEMEGRIKASWENNKQTLGNYTTRIAEMAQVPGLQAEDLTKVMTAAFEGRYGENGSQATVQFINENYPGQLSPRLYESIQSEIAAGRIDFRNEQKKLIDAKASYEIALNKPITGFWLHLAGFPKTDLSQFNIVTSSASERSYSTGVDNGMTLRPAAPATN